MPAGNYGGTQLSADQYNNAATIANTGYALGASPRDVQVALMAAMTESSLVNLHSGDRDSQGLFQQRPSQGWGTVAEVTDPAHAATSFFKALFAVPNRNNLSLQMEAQTVQRSAFSSGSNYAPWVALGDALVKALGGNPAPGAPGAGGGGILDAAGNAVGGAVSAVADVGSSLASIAKIFQWLAMPNHWMRIFSGAFGIAFIFVGISMLHSELRANG